MEELNMEELESIVTLTDENGNDVAFEYLDLIEYQGDEYVVLLPVEGNEDDEVIILKVEPIPGSEDEESYVSVDDEETLFAIFDIFKEHFADDFDFVEEE